MHTDPGTGPARRAGPAAASLRTWLLDPGAALPPLPLLREAGLAPYAYTLLPAGHPARDLLLGDVAQAVARHQQTRRAIRGLLAAWREAGIEAMLFKGFYLSEMLYPAAGTRVYADVDLRIDPRYERAAAGIAKAAGWREVSNTGELGRAWLHCAFTVHRPGGAAEVDVHRWLLHTRQPLHGVQRRITEQVWALARRREWEGVEVLEPDPVDTLVVGLALQRCWGDGARIRPRDAADVRLLMERGRVTREDALARARELGCERTVRFFLDRCDPLDGRLSLAAESSPPRLRLWWAAFRDQPALAAQRAVRWGMFAATMGRDLPPALRELVRARRALRPRGPGALREILEAVPPVGTGARGSLWERGRTIRAHGLVARVLGIPGRDLPLVRSLALYGALRRQGWPVSLVRGEGGPGAPAPDHTWLELDGEVLYELAEPANRARYRVVFEFPAGTGPERAGRSRGRNARPRPEDPPGASAS